MRRETTSHVDLRIHNHALVGKKKTLAFPKGDKPSGRFWFSPTDPNPGQIWNLASERGALCVYESQVLLRTEEYKNQGAANLRKVTADAKNPLEPSPPTDEMYLTDNGLASAAACDSTNRYFNQLERLYPEYKQLHQVYELVAMAAILRRQGKTSPLLTALSSRPVPTREVPMIFPWQKSYRLKPLLLKSGYAGYTVGGAISRLELERARFQTVRELDALFRHLDTICWEGSWPEVRACCCPSSGLLSTRRG